MSVIELGAVGEFLGAIAVVATLVYLTSLLWEGVSRASVSQSAAAWIPTSDS